MQLQDGIDFLLPAMPQGPAPVRWCDLGCGEGFFTSALASLLPAGSHIDAVDKKDRFERQDHREAITARYMRADFIQDDLPLAALDGILMANALHYVKDKPAFIQKARRWLSAEGRWVIIEYDTTRANPWVPYPLSFDALTALFRDAGYRKITRTSERRSLYNSGRMYCAAVQE